MKIEKKVLLFVTFRTHRGEVQLSRPVRAGRTGGLGVQERSQAGFGLENTPGWRARLGSGEQAISLRTTELDIRFSPMSRCAQAGFQPAESSPQ